MLSFGAPEHAHGKLICAVPVACMYGEGSASDKIPPNPPTLFLCQGYLGVSTSQAGAFRVAVKQGGAGS